MQYFLLYSLLLEHQQNGSDRSYFLFLLEMFLYPETFLFLGVLLHRRKNLYLHVLIKNCWNFCLDLMSLSKAIVTCFISTIDCLLEVTYFFMNFSSF